MLSPVTERQMGQGLRKLNWWPENKLGSRVRSPGKMSVEHHQFLSSVQQGKQGTSCRISLVIRWEPLGKNTSVIKINPFYYISCFLCFRNIHKVKKDQPYVPWWLGLGPPALGGSDRHIHSCFGFMAEFCHTLDPVSLWIWKQMVDLCWKERLDSATDILNTGILEIVSVSFSYGLCTVLGLNTIFFTVELAH